MGQPDSLLIVTISIAVGPPTIADRIFSRTLVVDLVLVAAGAALTTIAAQISIPWIPVPFTLQTFAVLLVGASIGPIRGAVSMALYVVLGLGRAARVRGADFGLDRRHCRPVATSSGSSSPPRWSGWFAQLKWDRNVLKMIVAFAAGSLVIYAFGVPWLYATYFASTGDIAGALNAGLWPFLLGDLLKAIVAGVLLPLAWRGVNKLEKKP